MAGSLRTRASEYSRQFRTLAHSQMAAARREALRLKLLEQENGRLLKAMAAATLEKLIAKEAGSGSYNGVR